MVKNKTLKRLIAIGKRIDKMQERGIILSERELNMRSWEKQFHRKRKHPGILK